MLQVGARSRDDALSLDSGARSFSPTVSMSFVSHVAPNAVADCVSGVEVSIDIRVRTQTDTYRKTFSRRTHEEMISADTIRAV